MNQVTKESVDDKISLMQLEIQFRSNIRLGVQH